jgi:hypothetical protein
LDIHVYWNILTMHGPIKVKSSNNTSKWQMGFNSAFKGLNSITTLKIKLKIWEIFIIKRYEKFDMAVGI